MQTIFQSITDVASFTRMFKLTFRHIYDVKFAWDGSLSAMGIDKNIPRVGNEH